MSQSKFANKRYGKKIETEPKIVKAVSIEPSLVQKVNDIHNNFSEFTRDAIEFYLIEVEKQIKNEVVR